MKKIKQFRRYQANHVKDAKITQEQKVDVVNHRYVYLDDERPCPAGWVLVKDSSGLFKIFDGPNSDKIERLSLDWYLGVGVVNGEEIARLIADKFREMSGFLPSLEAIIFHSSDTSAARRMCDTIADAIPEERRRQIGLLLG